MSSISVVIPTFNRSHLLRRAIESALQQTVPPKEVIVVDDGSTDHTTELCNTYRDQITYLRQANAGVAAARNLGILVARQPWIAFLDSDDYWTPDHLKRMAVAIDASGGEARFYFCDIENSGLPGAPTLWETIRFRPHRPFHFSGDATAWMLMKRQPASIQCSVFQTAALRESGGFDTRYSVTEDTELFCRLGIRAPACAVSGVGGVQTSDDQANRLSRKTSATIDTHWRCNAMLWHDVLDRFPSLDRSYHRLVRYNLADTYLKWSRLLWRSRKILPSVRNCVHGIRVAEPAFIGWLILHRSADGWEQRIRPPCNEVTTEDGLSSRSAAN